MHLLFAADWLLLPNWGELFARTDTEITVKKIGLANRSCTGIYTTDSCGTVSCDTSLCKVVYHPRYSRDQEIHCVKLYTIPDTAGTRRFIMQSCIPSHIQQGPGDSLCKVVYHPRYSRDQEIHCVKLYTIPDTAGTRRFIM